MKDVSYTAALLENINRKFEFLVEIIAPIKLQTDKIPQIEQHMEAIQADIMAIKAAAIKTNQNVDDHERRLRRLEAPTP